MVQVYSIYFHNKPNNINNLLGLNLNKEKVNRVIIIKTSVRPVLTKLRRRRQDERFH